MSDADVFLSEKLGVMTEQAQKKELQRLKNEIDPVVQQRKTAIAEFDAMKPYLHVPFDRLERFLKSKAHNIFWRAANDGKFSVRLNTDCNDFAFDLEDVMFETQFKVVIPAHIHAYLYCDFKNWCLSQSLTFTQVMNNSFDIGWKSEKFVDLEPELKRLRK
jgi:hypothetical protein